MLDQLPRSKWPVPLIEGGHFLSLAAATHADTLLASDQQYAAIPQRLRQFLSDKEKLRSIRENNCQYFDRHLAPEAVGKYICDQVEEANRLPDQAVSSWSIAAGS